jgi:hypothetical protein
VPSRRREYMIFIARKYFMSRRVKAIKSSALRKLEIRFFTISKDKSAAISGRTQYCNLGLRVRVFRRPVGTYLYLHVVGASNHVAVPSQAL